MKIVLARLNILLLFCCGLLNSCGNNEITIDGCKYRQYKGSLTISEITTKFDGRHNQRTAYGTFNPDDAEAPPDLKQVNLGQSLGYPEGRGVSIGEKVRVTVNYPISGSCPDKPIVQSPDN